MTNDIRVLEITKRRGRSSFLGWSYAIRFVEEGQSGDKMMWLDEFLHEHADGIKVVSDD